MLALVALDLHGGIVGTDAIVVTRDGIPVSYPAYPQDGNPLTVTAPREPGEYELRYILGADGMVIGAGPLQVVIVEATASLEAPDAVAAGKFDVVEPDVAAGEPIDGATAPVVAPRLDEARELEIAGRVEGQVAAESREGGGAGEDLTHAPDQIGRAHV